MAKAGQHTSSPTSPISAILAGGKSRRFGSPKGLARLGRSSMIERVVRVHARVFRQTVIAGDPLGWEGVGGLPVLRDLRPGEGPLGGLLTALEWARERGFETVCCSPCDAPFLEPALLRALRDWSGDEDAVVYDSEGGLQPLFARYSIRCIPVIEAALDHGERSVRRLVERLNAVARIPADGVPLRNPPSLVFLNVNTRGDLEVAMRHLEALIEDEG